MERGRRDCYVASLTIQRMTSTDRKAYTLLATNSHGDMTYAARCGQNMLLLPEWICKKGNL